MQGGAQDRVAAVVGHTCCLPARSGVTLLWSTSLVSAAGEDDDGRVTSRRAVAVLVTLVAALSGCRGAHRLAPTAQDPAAQITLPPGSEVTCPAYATVGADGHPAVPLAPTSAQRLA